MTMETLRIVLFLFVIFGAFFTEVSCIETTNDTLKWPTLKPEWPYCFEFTWFGSAYNNMSRYNGTCSDYLDETRAKGVPCAPPIVISFDGSLPDMHYLWDKHRSSILCKRAPGQRCVKYTYYFNNMINNVTYMCSKVQLTTGKIPSDGCYKEKVSEGYQREMCICKSSNGVYPPCNDSVTLNIFMTLIASCFLLNFLIKYI